jgi:hypothetical protein
VPEVQIKLQIAFEGGQIVAAHVTTAAADGLAKAMANGDAVFDLETEDGTYLVAIAKVVYVRRSSRETHIGFGASP